MKKLTAAQDYILDLVGGGSRHRGWIVDICKQRGYRVVNRSINSLVEQRYLSVDEDDYIHAFTPDTGRAELAAEPGGDVPVPELHRCPPLHMELANINGGMVGAQKLAIDELTQQNNDLRARLARAEAALVEAMERIALAQKQLEYVPEGKIDALNNQMVLESVNFAYSYLVDAPDAVKRILAGE